MSGMVRRAGRVRLDDGTLLIWSVADGRRGRRWRAMTSREGRLIESRLLEVGVDGRPGRLEITNAVGLLTLHPESSDLLQGNVVTSAGMRHVSLDWSDTHELAVDRSPIATAVTARRLSAVVPVGEARDVDVVVVTEELEVGSGRRRFERVTESAWRIEGGDRIRLLTIDADGIPVWPGGAGEPAEWPLELETPT